MQFSIMWQLALVHFILFVLQVVVCALLLRERGLGVWLMLAGSVVWMGDHFLFHITPFLPNMSPLRGGPVDGGAAAAGNVSAGGRA
jgi:hypothetical protein